MWAKAKTEQNGCKEVLWASRKGSRDCAGSGEARQLRLYSAWRQWWVIRVPWDVLRSNTQQKCLFLSVVGFLVVVGLWGLFAFFFFLVLRNCPLDLPTMGCATWSAFRKLSLGGD